MSDYKPITGELREYATVSWDPWPDARDRLYQMCDRIDAIHAGLERENAELKAELDRVTGKQEEHAHVRGDSITGELRDWYKDRIFMANGWQEINDIADRIDAEHERQLEVLYRDMSDAEYVKLPKDADGEVWRIGDELLDDGMVCEVVGIGPNRLYYYVDATDTVEWTQADSRRHHHAPTVEDVLREFYVLAVRGKEAHAEDVDGDVLAEYASKLRLVKEVDE